MEPSNKYVIISPVRNEARNIESTLISVTEQSVLPHRWIIVDDGSTDKTTEIIEPYTQQYPFISLLSLPDRGHYDLLTGGEIKAFYHGLDHLDFSNYDFLVKLDGDISFSPTYFEHLFIEFDKDDRLGIAGGVCHNEVNGELIKERSYKYHVRGAARAYRKECWDELGGTYRDLGWDAIDIYKARMLGWSTQSFDHIPMKHHVITWTKGGLYRGKMRSGRMEHLIGTHPLFFTLKVIKEISEKPYFLCSFALLSGYLKSVLSAEKRVAEPEVVKFIRKEQLKRIFSVQS